MTITDNRRRWLAFATLCCGDLLTVVDSTVVNVALPSIRTDLGFTEAGLSWVINAFMLTFGGFLLLGGRLGDLYGNRKLFLAGTALFTAASLICGVATSQLMLIVARAIQGMGGAVVSAIALSLIMNLFTEPAERVRAMGYFGFICAAGGSVGVFLGGLITDLLDWHWVFLVNLPIGAAVFLLSQRLLPAENAHETSGKLDLGGAITITLSLLLAIYAIVDGNRAGWTSHQTIFLLGLSGALMIAFLVIESIVTNPLMPLGLFKHRNLSISNVVGVLWAAAMFAWFFLSALYLQLVLDYDPMEVGLAFLPANLIMGAFSYKLSTIVVNRFGLRLPMALGLLLAGLGNALFALAPVGGDFLIHVLPPMILLGLGAGMAFNPVLLAAMSDVEPSQSGLASGVVNTSFMMGGALGLAVLASLAAAEAGDLMMLGFDTREALNAGYHLAFWVGAAFAFVAAALGLLIRPGAHNPGAEGVPH
jgi:EmrB/QacA subfamily drug resistance transporter